EDEHGDDDLDEGHARVVVPREPSAVAGHRAFLGAMSSGGGSAKGRGTRWSPAPSRTSELAWARTGQDHGQAAFCRPSAAEYEKPLFAAVALSPLSLVT